MNKTIALLLLAAVAGLGTTTGCYTMIKHPMADFSADEVTTADDGCGSCHGAEPTAWFPSNNQPWYPSPWWRDRDHDHGNGTGNGALPLEPEGRHAWDRGPGAPYVPPVGGSVTPLPSPSPSPSVPSGSDTTGTPPTREEKKDKDKGRHAWGR